MGMLIQGASMGLPVTIVSKGGLPVTLVDRTFSRSFDAVSYLGDDLIEMWDAARGDTVTATTDATYTNAVSSWLGLFDLGLRRSDSSVCLDLHTFNLKP